MHVYLIQLERFVNVGFNKKKIVSTVRVQIKDQLVSMSCVHYDHMVSYGLPNTYTHLRVVNNDHRDTVFN